MSDEQKELSERAQKFNAELIPLLGKYKLGLGAIPVLLPDGRIAAQPQLFDDSKPKEPPKVEEKPSLTEA
jgi:hypothetical protein